MWTNQSASEYTEPVLGMCGNKSNFAWGKIEVQTEAPTEAYGL